MRTGFISFLVVVVVSLSSFASELSSRLRTEFKGPIACSLLIATARFSTQNFAQPVTEARLTPFVSPEKPVSVRPIIFASGVKLFDMGEVTRKLDPKQSIVELEGAQKAALQKIAAGTSQRVLIMATKLDTLDQLAREMPNFASVVRELKKYLIVFIESGAPIRFPPILLLGHPGIGKTYFASRLAEVLGLENHFFSMNGITAGFILAGNSPQWKGAQMGKITEKMLGGHDANPIFVLDEIDKVSAKAEYNPMAPFYGLLEGNTAKNFRDEFLDIAIDASNVTWVLTANDIEGIPGPIRSRILTFQVPNPTPSEFKIIVEAILKKTLKEKYPAFKFSDAVSEAVLKRISEISPREVNSLIVGAMGNARLEGRHYLAPEDFNLSLVNLKHAPIGFTH